MDYRAVWDAQACDAPAARFAAWSEPAWAEGAASSLALLRASLPSAGRCLDLGCGVGRVAVEVASAGRPVTGVDISPNMLRHALAHPCVDYVLGDGTTLPCADDTFHGAWSMLVFQHLPDDVVAGYMRELMRVLRRGASAIAQFVVGDYGAGLDYRRSPETVAALASAAGLAVERLQHGAVHPEWCWLFAKRPAAG